MIIGNKKGVSAEKRLITQEMIEKMAQRRKFKHQNEEHFSKSGLSKAEGRRRETVKNRKK